MANPRRLPALERIEATKERLSKGGGRRDWGPEQEEAQQGAIDTVVDVITAPFDLVAWLVENWKPALIIVICLLILTRGK